MNFFDPIPIPIVIGMIVLAVLLVAISCVPTVFVTPLLRLLGIRLDEKDKTKRP